MNARILTAVFITIVLYGIYSWWTTQGTDSFDVNSQQYAPAEVYHPKVEAPVDRVVAPSGPASPSQAPPRNMPAVIMPEERPYDPQDQSYESAEIPERLRHPERSFSPGLVNDETGNAVAAGIASEAQQVTDNAYQTFGPEFATNGGSFLDNGVMANDSDMPSSYSSV
jgi:hypothetical protein